MAKYALIINGVVDTITFVEPAPEGWVQVADDVFPGDIDEGGVFSKPMPFVSSAHVNAERDRRILLPKTVLLTSGASFTCDMVNGGRENIGGLGTAALAKQAIGDTSTISFRAANNTDYDLTNAEIIEMGLQIAAQVQAIHVAARALKEMDPIPADYKDDPYWP